MKLLEGKKLSQNIKNQIKKRVTKCQQQPFLAVILVGDDSASHLYVKHKVMACHQVGIKSHVFHFPATACEQTVIDQIQQLNQDQTVHGILVQLPLPANFEMLKVLNTIAAAKDVDGLTALNAGKLLLNDQSAMVPCTAKGIMQLLAHYQIDLQHKNVVIINNSNIVGKPLALLCNNQQATVSLLHRATTDLKPYLQLADIIITATGVRGLFTSTDVKPGVVLVDVAIHKSENSKKVFGDLDAEQFATVAAAMTPVPGGVGPLTIAMLLENLILLYQQQLAISNLTNTD